MSTGAVILLGGSGNRFKSELPKQFVNIAGKPLFFHGTRVFIETGIFAKFYFVVNKSYQEVVNKALKHFPQITYSFITPGDTRQESVFNALLMADGEVDTVFIHDGARPLITPELIENCFNALFGKNGVCPAVPVTDSLFTISEDNSLDTYLDRSLVRAAQTPQCFPTSEITTFHRNAKNESRQFSDDASLYSYYGGKVKIVDGDQNNIKISYPNDIEQLRVLLNSESL